MKKKKNGRYFLLTLFLLLFVLMLPVAYGGVPQTISYQGEILEDGVALTGTRTVTFSLWDSDMGGNPASALWHETQSVEVTDGIYNVALGAVTALPADLYTYDALFLQIDILHPGEGLQTLKPLMPIRSTAFALKAGHADVAEIALEADFATSADTAANADKAAQATTADTAAHADNADHATSADTATNAGHATSADNATKADSATSADTAAEALHATKADHATNSDTATNATHADNADHAIDAANATKADSADTAGTAAEAGHAANADHATTAGDADTVDGKHAGDFMPAGSDNWVDVTGDTMTGALTVATEGTAITIDGDSPSGNARGVDAEIYGEYYTIALRGEGHSEREYAMGVYGLGWAGTTSNNSSYGLYGDANHLGSSGETYGLFARALASDAGNSMGVYGEAKKLSDEGGTAYGGYFYGRNTGTGEGTYGVYAEAEGNGPKYGLYAYVTDSSDDHYGGNHGVYSEVSNDMGGASAFKGKVRSEANAFARGMYLDVDKSLEGLDDLSGVEVDVRHYGASGHAYGFQSVVYPSDEGKAYGGYFSVHNDSGETGDLYGVYAYVNNNGTTADAYAGYFKKDGGGDYAGYFEGNVHVNGTLTATSKPFIQPHKSDPTKEIVYVSLEGPEHAVFIRGSAALEEGEAVIEMPEYWQQVAAEEGITVNLTPEGAWAPLYVASKSVTEVVVRVAQGGPMDAAFCYTIMAKRDGFQAHEPIQENTHFTAKGKSARAFENQYSEDTLENIAVRNMLKQNGILSPDGKLNRESAEMLGWKIAPDEEDPNYAEALRGEEEGKKQSVRPPRPIHKGPEGIDPIGNMGAK